MRRLILTILLVCISFVGFAQRNSYRNKGYKGDVAFGLNADLSCECGGVALFTTHGYQINKTWFVGGGIGYENEMLPVYFDTKAYFSKKTMKVNPWIEAKLGFDAINGGWSKYWHSFALGKGLCPNNRFSLGYEYRI